MHRKQLLPLINDLKGKIFHFTWITKNGEVRTSNARRKVSKGINGRGKRRISQADNSLIGIYILPTLKGKEWDFRSGWRSLNLDTVTQITCNNKTHVITPEIKDNDVAPKT